MATAFQFYCDLFSLIELVEFDSALIVAMAVSGLIYLRVEDHRAGIKRDPSVETFRLPLAIPIVFLICDLFILVFTA